MTLNNKFAYILFVLIIILSLDSCKKDENVEPIISQHPDEVFIGINDSSSYNQKNFIISFNQIFFSEMRWAHNFTHDFNDKSILIKSNNNWHIYGAVGNGFAQFEHDYNDLGFITHSIQSITDPHNGGDRIIEYEYDKLGFIIRTLDIFNDEIKKIVEFEFNEEHQLITKKHKTNDGFVFNQETFVYDIKGRVIEIISTHLRQQFIYENDLLVEIEIYDGSTLDEQISLGYDDELRIESIIEFSDYKIIYKYENDRIICYSYINNQLDAVIVFEAGMFQRSNTEFEYIDDEFDYAIKEVYDNDGRTVKKYCYSGETTNLDMQGYSIINSVEQTSERNRREVYFTPEGENKYYAEYKFSSYNTNGGFGHTISDIQWFMLDGTLISGSDILEDWVKNLSIY